MDNLATTVEELNQQGRVLHSVGNYEAAIEQYEKAEKLDPMFVETYFNMGEAYIMSDKFDKAREVFSKVLLIDKHSGITYYHLGNVEFLCDNFELGREYYAKAVNAGYDDAQLYFNLGRVFEDRGENDEAVKYYNKAVAKDKFRADAKLNKALIFIRENKISEAIQALDNIIEFTPDVFEGHHYKIMLLIQQNDFERAEKALEKAMSMFPDDEGFIFDKVLLLEKQEKLDEALKLMESSLAELNNRDVNLEKAKILLAQGKSEEGIKLFEAVKQQDGEDFDDEVRFYLISIYISTGEFAKALEYCNEVIKNDSQNTYFYSAVYLKAEALKASGKEVEAKTAFEEAIKIFKSASAKAPGELNLIIYRALCFKALKQYDRAFEMIDYLLAINENMGDAYLIRSEIYKELGETEKAAADRAAATSNNTMIKMVLGQE